MKIIFFKCWYICFCFYSEEIFDINFVWCINNDRIYFGFYFYLSINEKYIWLMENIIIMYRKLRNLFNLILVYVYVEGKNWFSLVSWF